jgi:hypothetical protein
MLARILPGKQDGLCFSKQRSYFKRSIGHDHVQQVLNQASKEIEFL